MKNKKEFISKERFEEIVDSSDLRRKDVKALIVFARLCLNHIDYLCQVHWQLSFVKMKLEERDKRLIRLKKNITKIKKETDLKKLQNEVISLKIELEEKTKQCELEKAKNDQGENLFLNNYLNDNFKLN
jgi:hypothetical protein